MKTNILDYVTAAGNALFAPDTAKQYGTYGNALVSDSMIAHCRISKVADFDDVAYYYHLNAYRVDENYIQGTTTDKTIFTYVNTRYYFNYLQCSQVSIHLTDIINDNVTLSSIVMRLNQGMRLWNVIDNEVNIGDFTYDNVEKSYMTTEES